MSQLYYNPACSKCRTARSILEEDGIEVSEVRYLDDPPTVAELELLMTKLGIEDPRQMMRTGEAIYSQLGLAAVSGADLLAAIVAHPILLERPIFVRGDQAVIARPPELLRTLL